MSKLKDLVGIRFGRLTVISRSDDYIAPSGYRTPRWECRCDCGKKVIVLGSNLKRGKTISCGCFSAESIRKTENHYVKHGGYGTRLYKIWGGMHQRCYNQNDRKYHDYGGRGIVICDEWKECFESFREWALKNGYESNLSIDRIDNDGIYEPNNCRWATSKEQQNNKRTNVIININGEEHNLMEWCEKTGIPYGTLQARYRAGKRGVELLKTEE